MADGLAAAVAAAGVVGLSGCAGPGVHGGPDGSIRPAGAVDAGSAGAAWDLVLPSPEVAQRPGVEAEASWESWRRDEALAAGADGSPTRYYEPEAVPDVWRTRRVFVSERPNQFMYFQPTRGRREWWRREY